MKKRNLIAAGIALMLALVCMFTACGSTPEGSSGTASTGSVPDYYKLYNISFPFYGQNLGAKSWNGNLQSNLVAIIQLMSRSTTAVWTDASPWDGDYSQVNVNAFIYSGWGEQTAKLWEPIIRTSTPPGAGEANYDYWYRVSMNPEMLAYWDSIGLTKAANRGANLTDINDDYYVYYPKGANADTSGKKYPLIILFHSGGEAAAHVESSGFCQLAAKENFFIMTIENSDYKAAESILEKVLADYLMIDRTRLYAAGSSQGGYNSSRFAFEHPEILAAVGIMEQPIADSISFNSPEELAQYPNFKAHNMPIVFLGGLADTMGLYNVRTREYFMTHPGAAPDGPVGSPKPGMDFVQGWNRLLAAYGITGKDFTNLDTRLAYADAPGALEVTYYTGYPFDKSEIITSYGCKVYKNTFDANERLLSYVVENRPHMPSGYDAELIWDFISRWSRVNGVSVE